jgi:GH35 family endo-1,4-beta-xylanase
MKSQSSATLGTTSFVGTYLVVPTGGATVNFKINATEGSTGAGDPHMQLVIADTTASFSINSTSATDYTTSNITLPAGTYIVRDERDFTGNVASSRSFTVNNLSVNSVSGNAVSFSNVNDGTTALAAADTYINNFRKGTATVSVTGPGNIPLLPGTALNTNLARIAFNFGTAVPGSSPNGVGSYLGSSNTTQQQQYQAHLLQNFNAIVPENMGKWGNDEPTQGSTGNMSGIDTMLNYAQAHHLNVRMHNVIWGSQQPSFATTLLSQAAAGSLTSQTTLRNDISSRIGYYVGTGTASDRSTKFQQLDVYNESYHTGQTVSGSYWNVYTPTGIADIYRQIHAVAPNVPLFVNEYNIYEDGADRFANYYQQHLEQLRSAGIAAGYGDVLGGIGTQYYPDQVPSSYGDPNAGTVSNSAHNPARMMQTLQNLSTEGLPITLTEFGVKPPGASGAGAASISLGAATLQSAATILSDSMRMVFGNPNATGFMMWGFQAEGSGTTFGTNLFQGQSALYTVVNSGTLAWQASSWTLTPAGQAWQTLLGIQNWGVNGSDGKALQQWTTQLNGASAPIVGPDGKITFNGYYGDYNIGNQSAFSNLSLVKGTSQYSLNLAAPPSWFLWKTTNSGSWSNTSNWTNAPAGAAGDTAYFGSATAPRSVTVDGPRTVGMLAFDSAQSYTIGGSTITLAGLAGQAAVYVNTGSHEIDSPLALTNDTTITVGPSASTLTITNLQSGSVALTKAGSGTLVVNSLNQNSASITGGTLKIQPVAPAVINAIGSLTLAGGPGAWSSQIDLTNGNLILMSTPDLPTVDDQVRSGWASGSWTGAGITSSSAATVAADSSNPHKTAVGFAQAGVLGLTTLGGQTLTPDDIILRYALVGDANLDGTVNALDFNVIATNFGAAGTWQNGDFNHNDVIDTSDFEAMALNFNSVLQTPALGSVVPEPVSVFSLAALLIGRRRRR